MYICTFTYCTVGTYIYTARKLELYTIIYTSYTPKRLPTLQRVRYTHNYLCLLVVDRAGVYEKRRAPDDRHRQRNLIPCSLVG